MKIEDILQAKGTTVHSTSPEHTLAEVVDKLVEANCGSLIVLEGGKMIGIITERDILRACSKNSGVLAELAVKDHMSKELVTGSSTDDVSTTMGQMTSHRIRHLPIVDNDQLKGIVSIGDIVKAQHDRLSVENHYLKEYIQS